MRPKRTATHTTDHDGAAVVLVPLANGRGTAKLLKEDFESLQARIATANWFLYRSATGNERVRCHCRGAGSVTVARLIARPGRDQNVTHRDYDATNLRRDNLKVTERAVVVRHGQAVTY